MENYVRKSAKYQKDFEIGINMLKEHHLEKSITNQVSSETQKNTGAYNLVGEIEKLNELYKSGALTKSEFDKAKNKLLNN